MREDALDQLLQVLGLSMILHNYVLKVSFHPMKRAVVRRTWLPVVWELFGLFHSQFDLLVHLFLAFFLKQEDLLAFDKEKEQIVVAGDHLLVDWTE